jgi:hypothetical protein
LEPYENEPELLPMKKPKPKEKAKNLKPCLLKPDSKLLKQEAAAKKLTKAKRRICFLNSTENGTCESKATLHLLLAG